jgi:hypothetical protein
MARKTLDEVIEGYDKRIEQLTAQKRLAVARKKEDLRKKRNHRLIETGAVVESVCGEISDFENFKKYLAGYVDWYQKVDTIGVTVDDIGETATETRPEQGAGGDDERQRLLADRC